MIINVNEAISTISQKYEGIDSIENALVLFKKDKDSTKEIVPFCEVELYDQKKKEYIKSTWSNKQGRYSFPNLNQKDFIYFIVAHHPKKVSNGVVADNIGGRNVDD